MRTALYFPHTEVRSKALVKSALLTWDKLEWIAPYREFRPDYDDVGIARAIELIGSGRAPTDAERDRAHELIAELVERGVPDVFRYVPSSGKRNDDYELWPQKLARRTWHLLAERGLIGGFLDNMDYPASQAAGLSLMAVLADVMAGKTRARITDRALAYATLSNAAVDGEASSPVQDHMVPLSFSTVGVDRIPLNVLIDIREREEREPGGGLRDLRRDFLAALEAHVARIASVAIGSRDRIELDRMFLDDMDRDFRELKRELGFSRREAWLTKDVTTLVLAGGTLLAAAAGAALHLPEVLTGAGAAATVGGVLTAGNKLARARYETLRKHPMAYLYEVDRLAR